MHRKVTCETHNAGNFTVEAGVMHKPLIKTPALECRTRGSCRCEWGLQSPSILCVQEPSE